MIGNYADGGGVIGSGIHGSCGAPPPRGADRSFVPPGNSTGEGSIAVADEVNETPIVRHATHDKRGRSVAEDRRRWVV
jgi:hypothetical protein